MLRRSYLIALCVAAIGWLVYARFSAPRPPSNEAISIDGGTIVVENRTEREWRNVVVTVNDHFHGGTRSLAPGGRLTAPLSQLETSHGQRFDRRRQTVVKIEVKATAADGEAVRLEWHARTTT
jgi:hypothetical protein